VLRHENAHATFFEIGEQIPGRSELLKRMLFDGNEIGNHTTHHVTLPGEAEIADTQRLIQGATGFRPCLLRPPGGELDSGVLAAAADLDLTTVTWDVDPRDWSNPGAGAIRAAVTGAVQPGSIVDMHDGGGDRSQTLAALPAIIRELHHRGYRLVTVTELLGGEMIFPGPGEQP
jgi:peptidoglycan/xylan/chitin deacetylase (PgdA/CDA1 family)